MYLWAWVYTVYESRLFYFAKCEFNTKLNLFREIALSDFWRSLNIIDVHCATFLHIFANSDPAPVHKFDRSCSWLLLFENYYCSLSHLIKKVFRIQSFFILIISWNFLLFCEILLYLFSVEFSKISRNNIKIMLNTKVVFRTAKFRSHPTCS
jgi:hypothetical protein